MLVVRKAQNEINIKDIKRDMVLIAVTNTRSGTTLSTITELRNGKTMFYREVPILPISINFNAECNDSNDSNEIIYSSKLEFAEHKMQISNSELYAFKTRKDAMIFIADVIERIYHVE